MDNSKMLTNRSILYMANFKADGSVQLCKVKPKRILPIMLARGFIEIEAAEWQRLHAIKRGLPMAESEA